MSSSPNSAKTTRLIRPPLRRLVPFCAFSFAGLLCCAGQVRAQSTGMYYSRTFATKRPSATMVTYPVPSFVGLTGSKYSSKNGVSKITLRTRDTIPSQSGEKFTFEVYFNASSVNGERIDTVVASTHGSFTYPSSPNLEPETAAVIDLNTGFVLGGASLEVNGSTITIVFDSALVNGAQPELAVARYLPENVDIATVAGGLSTNRASTLILNAELAKVSLMIPGVARSAVSGSGARVPTEPLIIDIGLPPSSTCPPSPSDNIPQDDDVNGDGVADWDYPGVDGQGDDTIPGTDQMVGVWGIDLGDPGPGGGDSFQMGIGEDDNGNGQLDPEEIDDWIGQCPWPNGQNTVYFDPNDGTIHWISDDAPAGNDISVTHFIYDTDTGQIKVYVKDESGVLQPVWGPGNPDDYLGWK